MDTEAPVVQAPSEPVASQDTALVPQQQKPKRIRWYIPALLFLLICSLGISILLYTDTFPFRHADPTTIMKEQPVFGAKIIYKTGTAWTLMSGRRTELLENDDVQEKTEIITDANTRLVLSFDDGSIVRIGPESHIILSSLSPQTMIVSEKQGTVFARVHKDATHTFVVQAGFASIKALGTAFAVENKESVKVHVFESTVEVTGESIGNPIEIKENQQWTQNDTAAKKQDEKELARNEFLTWSISEDAKTEGTVSPTATNTVSPTSTPKPTSKNTPTAAPSTAISLSATTGSNGISLSWSTGVDAPNGFKIVKNTSGNPTFPDNAYQLVDGKTRSLTIGLTDGQTWYFRVCRYQHETCEGYSNTALATAPNNSTKESSQPSHVSSITLRAEKITDNKVHLSWDVNGTSSIGYKIVWSQNENPVYPGNEYHYLSDQNDHDDDVDGLEYGKTWHFRVCEYLGGACGTYSNNVSIKL